MGSSLVGTKNKSTGIHWLLIHFATVSGGGKT